MKNKNKLYEIFAKVNKLPLNEQDDLDATQEMDDLKDNLSQNIQDEDVKKFDNDTVPNEMELNTFDFDRLELVLNDEYGLNGSEFLNGVDGQLNYQAQYVTKVKEFPVIITVPYTVMIEKNYTGGGTNFYIKNISMFFNKADININE